jgi:hypothetical protein
MALSGRQKLPPDTSAKPHKRTKRTSPVTKLMSAYDPKQTVGSIATPLEVFRLCSEMTLSSAVLLPLSLDCWPQIAQRYLC